MKAFYVFFKVYGMSLFLLCMLGGLQLQFEDVLGCLLPGFSNACVKSSFDADCSGSLLFILFRVFEQNLKELFSLSN